MVVWNQSSDILSGVRGCSKWALEGMCHLVVSKHAWVDDVCATSIDLKLYDFSWTSALEAGPCNHGESWLKLLLWMVLPAFLDFEYWKCMYMYIYMDIYGIKQSQYDYHLPSTNTGLEFNLQYPFRPNQVKTSQGSSCYVKPTCKLLK